MNLLPAHLKIQASSERMSKFRPGVLESMLLAKEKWKKVGKFKAQKNKENKLKEEDC